MGKIIINTCVDNDEISSEFDIDASGGELISAAVNLTLNAMEIVYEKEKLDIDEITRWCQLLMRINTERQNQHEKIPESDRESETGKKEV